jgi:hypothetical protein
VSKSSEFFAALRHPAEPKVLLLRSGGAWRLPRVLSPNVWIADAAAITEAFEQRLGTSTWFLRQLTYREDEDERLRAVVELELLDEAWTPPRHGRWIGGEELERLRLEDEEHRPLLAEHLRALGRDEVPPERPPWARSGWRERVLGWLELEVTRLGHSIERVEQVKQWSISSILRVHTDGPLLYLKVPARLPLFVEEGRVTAALAERFPGYAPEPLAVEPDEGWFLLADLGDPVGWGAPIETRAAMLRRFAGLQRRSAALTDELLADGCLDRRLNVLEGQLDALIADAASIPKLAAEEVAELRRRAPELKDVCRRLAELGLPYTLVHGDLHLGNVALVEGELVYFDWTDACVAHPFFDLHTLQWERDEEVRAALLDAYLAEWEGVIPPDRLREAAALAAVVTPLHHAVSYRHIVAGLEPTSKSELDATHEFLRESLEKLRNMPDP